MSMKSIASEVNRLLKPIGFTSQRYVWNRKVASFTDVIDLQVSKSRDTVTINVGVLDVEVHTLLWDDEPAGFVKLPARTVDARIGQLIDDKDKWWEIDDSSVAVEIVKSITAYALPFLEQMHAREAMIRWLTSIDVIKRRYPLPYSIWQFSYVSPATRGEAVKFLATLRRLGRVRGECVRLT